MTSALVLDREDVRVYHADYSALARVASRRDDGTVCDALITDAPYSERTHKSHDAGVDQTGNDRYKGRASNRTAAAGRRPLSYSPWSVEEVDRFVDTWAPLTRGWICSITDHVLSKAWEAALERAGLYVFAPLACVDSGSRVRLVGDGPSNWSVWLIVARPRDVAFQRWGTLPGGYVIPKGGRIQRDRRHEETVVGGKPPWLMDRLVEDYSRPGDLVCDPCVGSGETLLAAMRTGRRALGGDAGREHAELAARRCGRAVQRPLFSVGGL